LAVLSGSSENEDNLFVSRQADSYLLVSIVHLAVPPLGPTHNTPTRIPWGSPGGPTTRPSTRPHHKTVQDSPRENEHLIQRSLARVPAPAKTEGQTRGNRVAVAGTYEFRRPDPVFLIDRAKDEINLCESRGQCVPSAQRGRGLPSARRMQNREPPPFGSSSIH